MRATREYIDNLRERIAPHDTPERRARYVARGLGDRRYRWDLLWTAYDLAPFSIYGPGGHMTDASVDTALRRIVPPLDTPTEEDDGASGQDRKSYSDTQDRDSYTSE